MSHQCPFPVRSTDNRRCYRTGNAPGFALCLAVVAALSCYAGFGHAAASARANTLAAISGTVPAFNDTGGPITRD